MPRWRSANLPFSAVEDYLERMNVDPDFTARGTTKFSSTAATKYPMSQLAEETGIDRRQLYRYIASGCNLEQAERLADALDVYPTEIWGQAYHDAAIYEETKSEPDSDRVA